jgi:hypothetical protein
LVNLVLGDDVWMHEVIDMASKALVGLFLGRRMGKPLLKTWLPDSWEPVLGYMPKFYVLVGRCMGFILHLEEDVKKIMDTCWQWDSSMMFIKKWTPLFDALSERMDLKPSWVNILGLPVEFWSYEVFKEMGNLLGSFCEADMSFDETETMSITRILVGIDLREGPTSKLVLQKESIWISQALDYSSVPFKCYRCQVYDHVAQDCTLSFYPKAWEKERSHVAIKKGRKASFGGFVNIKDSKGSGIELTVVTNPVCEEVCQISGLKLLLRVQRTRR